MFIMKYPPIKKRASYLLMRIAMQCGSIESKIRQYGTDVPVYEAEIHLIKAIEETDIRHVSGLAGVLGVTKGAVSQLIAKLHKKGLVEKAADENNLSKLSISLTGKGKSALARHEEVHEMFDALVEKELSRCPAECQGALLNFLKDVSLRLDSWQE